MGYSENVKFRWILFGQCLKYAFLRLGSGVWELCEFKLRSAGNLNLMWYIRREKTNQLTYTEQQVLCDWGNSFWKILLI